jgi:hypothetical protein
MPIALYALTVGAFGIGVTEFVIMGLLMQVSTDLRRLDPHRRPADDRLRAGRLRRRADPDHRHPRPAPQDHPAGADGDLHDGQPRCALAPTYGC